MSILWAIPTGIFVYGLWCFFTQEGYFLGLKHGGYVTGRAAQKIGIAYMVIGVYVAVKACIQNERVRGLGFLFDWICFIALAALVFLW